MQYYLALISGRRHGIGPALLRGFLWTISLPYDLAVSSKAKPDRNLPGRLVSRRDPARAQGGSNVARVCDRILRRRAMPCRIDHDGRTVPARKG